MHIKEIKINGFKSFADKVNIELNKNFTCIVGPNGSGKSNIVDAIKWVLGEQSIKSLRATYNMSDIIFNGSKSRNPSTSAIVSILFDNKDHSLQVEYDEVQVKRILYRSGENEYYINGEKCRLKDITDLFLSNFSVKDGINIIAQGKINEILSSKPEDKRIILEEASGVLKYKKRKEECYRKLERTHENMSRIDMIIKELDMQVNPLKVESEKAKKYNDIKDKLTNIDISLMVKDINENVMLLDKNKSLLLELKDTSTHKRVEITKYETTLEKDKLKLIKLEEEESKYRNNLLKLNDELNSISNKKDLILERTKYDKNTNEVKNRLINLQELELKYKNEISLLNEEIKIKIKEEDSLNSKLELLTEENKTITQKLEYLKNEWTSNTKETFELNNKLNILKNNLNYNTILPYSVKTLLSTHELKGINNIVGKLFECKEDYINAISTSLGYSVNYIVTDSENDSKDAIKYLKENKKGRATFLPLDVIKPRSIDPLLLDKIKDINGYIDLASNIITYDKKYYNIFMNLLGNVVVVDNIDNASIISKKIYNRYRVVTLDGDIINVGGSLTGGSKESKTNILNANYEISVIEIKLKNNNEHKLNIVKEEKEIEKKLNEVKENIYGLNLNLMNVKELIKNKEELLNSKRIEYDNILQEIKDLTSKDNVNDIVKKIMDKYYLKEDNRNKVKTSLDKIHTDILDIKNEINEIDSFIKKSNTEEKKESENINSLEIEITKCNMITDNLLSRLNEEYGMTFERAKQNYFLDIDDEEARKLVVKYKESLKQIGDVNLKSIDEFERVNKRYEYLINEKNDLIDSEKNILEVIDKMDNIMLDKFKKTFDKVNIEFNKVFKTLFNGGSSSLVLTEPNNLLTSGIEIIANPPGKRSNPISLLSGGEKTLTAICLLFSIMNLKKFPFVILDEVESALDEHNVEKFGEYIKNYKDRTQLLIITHKKKTMEYVDTLYGLTMEESGVSKLVSVRLEENKQI